MAHEHSHGSATHSHSHSGAADHAPHDLQVPDSESHHQATVVATFDSYLRQALSANQRRRGDFFSLPVAQQALLPDYADLLSEVRVPPGSGAGKCCRLRSSGIQVDTRLIVTNQFVGQMVEQNPFAPSEDAALSAPAPTEGDHEVSPGISSALVALTSLRSVYEALCASSQGIGARRYAVVSPNACDC